MGTQFIVKKCTPVSLNQVMPDEQGYCQAENLLYMFSHHTCELDCSNIYVLELYNLELNQTRMLLKINDSVDKSWNNIHSGCFSFFHYSIVKDSKCVLDFVF